MPLYLRAQRCHYSINRRISGSDNKGLLKSGLSGTKLVEKIIDEYGIVIRTKPIRKRKLEMQSKDGITCLGIESTAL